MKKIFDPLHGFIRFFPEESLIILSRPFQRLRYINQLGVAYLVYPGAVHKRFEHSLGVMHIATLIYDHLFEEKRDEYWRQVLRAAALCHDLGHLPFSHTAERAVLKGQNHEDWTLKVIKSADLQPAFQALGKKFSKDPKEVMDDVSKIAVRRGQYREDEDILCQIITGDFFGADRIDYLLRDARSTGVAYGLFDYHQLIEMLIIINGELGIEENGIESCEALLLARHFMFRRIYHYSSVKACTYHLSAFMEKRYCNFDLEAFLSLTDNEVLADMSEACKQGDLDAASLLFQRPKCLVYALSKEAKKKADRKIKLEKINDGQMPKLNFPVLMRDGTLKRGEQVSSVTLKQTATYWAYIEEGADQSLGS